MSVTVYEITGNQIFQQFQANGKANTKVSNNRSFVSDGAPTNSPQKRPVTRKAFPFHNMTEKDIGEKVKDGPWFSLANDQ